MIVEAASYYWSNIEVVGETYLPLKKREEAIQNVKITILLMLLNHSRS